MNLKSHFLSLLLVCMGAGVFISCTSSSKNVLRNTLSAEQALLNVYSYGFVDLEGAKVSAIIAEYDRPLLSSSVSSDDFEITNYTKILVKESGFEKIIELDYDGIRGNEGAITKVYVNDKPEISSKGKKSGKYVVIEVNSDYMISSENLSYTASMLAGIKQVGDVEAENALITASAFEKTNYIVSQKESRRGTMTVYSTDKSKIILPEFAEGSGWTLHRIGESAFNAVNCYSEYDGKYYDFELPYSMYVPDRKIMDRNKGKICLVLHMEHAGAGDSDPMSAITSSRASVILSGAEIQNKNPSIVLVPQIEDSRRTTDDLNASSEALPAIWQLVDSVLEQYKDCIDTDRIYATGQSMGGMAEIYMQSQRDNFFAGIAVIGSQWGSSYNKAYQHNGAPDRSPENDPVSFNGFGLDKENYQNWYYMISDDNIMVHTCAGDPMATGEWSYLTQYFAAAGIAIPHEEWDPYLPLSEQYAKDRALAQSSGKGPGSGIIWGAFSKGSHMSTWKYGYRLTYPFEWLFTQRRSAENQRGKVMQLKNPWLGRDSDGNILPDSGTSGLNSAQFGISGAVETFGEGWTVN